MEIIRQAFLAWQNANVISRPNDPAQELEYAAVAAALGQAYATDCMAEAMTRMAAAAEQQAAELRMVREVLETLLDTMAAEVQP